MSKNNSNTKLVYLIDLVERTLPLRKWGFQQHVTFTGSSSSKIDVIDEGELLPYVIYNSEYCRVKFLLDYSGYGRSPGLWVFYGRLHAPDNEILKKQNGDECYCWHKFGLMLHFLDGKSPQDVADSQSEEPQGIQEFLRLGLIIKTISQPEWTAKLHSTVWEFYGLRFFHLFDLRNPKFWDEYEKFLKNYYDLVGRNPAHKPSLDKIC